ncbi:MAG: PilZ domain-containing protein [Nitrospira sp.]|nr:PilZ domain-containing protein [Nitrospira sp.]
MRVELLPSYNTTFTTGDLMRHFALRHHYRFPVFGQVKYESQNREGSGSVTNVSAVGWRISGTLPVQVGAVCSLSVRLPTMQVCIAAGKVRWVRGDECGIETLVMSEETEARLNQYILARVKAL